MRRLINLLCDPLVEEMDVDGDERINLHRKILANKHMLREVFTEFHHIFKRINNKYFHGIGIEIELGAGVSPVRDSYAEVLATDIIKTAHLDCVINAECMALEDGSVRVIYGQNCFHHFPHPDKFLCELDRVLVNGGGAILLEPYYGPLASFLYKRLFRTEGFDKQYPSWEAPVEGPMNGANQALSYIVFERDKAEFERKHPSLKIVQHELVGNYLKYLISGGLNFRQLLPDSFTRLIGFVEKIMSPFNKWIALHHVIVIRKDDV